MLKARGIRGIVTTPAQAYGAPGRRLLHRGSEHLQQPTTVIRIEFVAEPTEARSLAAALAGAARMTADSTNIWVSTIDDLDATDTADLCQAGRAS